MKRKIAIIDPLGAHGSSHHYYLFGQADGLIKSDVEVILYTNKETKVKKNKRLKLYQFYGKLFSSKYKIVSGVKYLTGSVLSVFHGRISGCTIFHFHVFRTRIYMLFNLILVKMVFGKVVLTIHDISAFANNNDVIFFSKWIYKLTDLVLTHNEFSKTEILKLNNFNLPKIKIIPHGNYIPFIDIQKDKLLSRKKLGIPENKKVLLFFGMIKKVKGLEILLKALVKVKEKHTDVLLLIAGKVWENDFGHYQEIIDKNNLQDFCLLHTKFIPDLDVAHYYCASDLVVLPYKKIYQSGVLIMTLSFGKPILVSNLSPIKEIITDNKNGFLFETENVESLTKRINFILKDKMLLEKVGKEGYKLILTNYNWEGIGRKTKEAYQTV
jgi:glycosyltransferase involved in cell wall biosynthesis